MIFFARVIVSWNIGDYRNFFLKLKSKKVLHHDVLTSLRTSPEKLTLAVVEMRQLTAIENTFSKDEMSLPKWTF